MTVLWIIAGVALLASFVSNRRKTRTSLIKGLKMFWGVLPLLLGVLALVSLVLAAITPGMLQHVLSGSGPLPFFTALGIGSIALMPGFIAYPLAGLLRQNGASTPVLAAFITSLMMVGDINQRNLPPDWAFTFHGHCADQRAVAGAGIKFA